MASLQEQLIKAGLVDRNKANQVKKDKQKQANAARKAGAKGANKKPSTAQSEQAMRAERDRELNRQKQQQLELRAAQAQIRQLIEANRIDRGHGEIAYSFVFKNKVKKLYVTEELRRQLSQGKLAIARLVLPNDTSFEIVPNAIAEKIAQRDASSLVKLNSDSEATPPDDAYADYKIPDDLTW